VNGYQSPKRLDTSLGPIDPGELEAISLAIELNADLFVVDDRKARHAASVRGVPIPETSDLWELATARGLLDLPIAVSELRKKECRIADDLLEDALGRDTARRTTKG
jgi:predicted nucleic acid-binding protein